MKKRKKGAAKKSHKLQYFDIMINDRGSVIIEPWNTRAKKLFKKEYINQISPYCG